MKHPTDFSNITIQDLAAVISQHLKNDGIDTVLVGGACVSIYSKNLYQSYDLDYVTFADHKLIEHSLKKLKFSKKGKYFHHPDCPFFIEFVAPPVAIGEEPVHSFHDLKTKLGTIRMLTATDSLKDRLASYFHWNDLQSLDQALAIWSKTSEKIDLDQVRDWSQKEGHLEKFELFLKEIHE